MKRLWKSSLALSLGFLVTGARAGENAWQPVVYRPAGASQQAAATPGQPIAAAGSPSEPAATLGRPVVSLDRPVPLANGAAPAPADPQVRPTSFRAPGEDTGPVFRGKSA